MHVHITLIHASVHFLLPIVSVRKGLYYVLYENEFGTLAGG